MRIGIVGLGYVGLPLAVAFAEAGHAVIGIDVDPRKIGSLGRGESYIGDIDDARLARVSDALELSTSYAPLRKADAILVCVPTPLTANREPDLTPLVDTANGLVRVLRAGQVIVLESTTFPGTTREYFAPILEESGLAAGTDFHLAFSPERVDPGRTDYTLRTTPKVLGGLTPECAAAAERVYREVCDTIVPVSTPEAAELTKLLENIFRSVNIALVNELSLLCDRMGIDVWEVIDAASTKPYGFMRFEPGPGMGGHCLPVDPFYLSWRARNFDMSTEFIELAGKINQTMPYHCVERIEHALNEQGKPANGSKVALLGVSYKPGVGDVRESPALKIVALLLALGADVSYHDPYVPELPTMNLRSCPFEEVRDADLVVIATAHPGVDAKSLADSGCRMVDLRGALREPSVTHVAAGEGYSFA